MIPGKVHLVFFLTKIYRNEQTMVFCSGICLLNDKL